jgi:hypothetical protein
MLECLRFSPVLSAFFYSAILLISVGVVANDVQACIRIAQTIIIPQSFHALTLVRNVISGVLHLVAFEQEEPPRHGHVKINACTSPLFERVNLYIVLACEIDLQSYEEGRKEFLVLPPARLP